MIEFSEANDDECLFATLKVDEGSAAVAVGNTKGSRNLITGIGRVPQKRMKTE